VAQIEVRTAEPADYDAIGRLSVAAYEADGQLAGEHGYEKVLADVATRAAEGVVLVAVEETAVLGAVLFVLPGSRYAELCGPDEAEFRMLAVDPAAQGRGAGELLVRACLNRAAEAGARGLRISVRDFAAPAQRLYARLGFTRTPDRDWSPMPGVNLLALHHDLSAW
jgi:ribosomal protein S18 acetylase RimI-like enzyme